MSSTLWTASPIHARHRFPGLPFQDTSEIIMQTPTIQRVEVGARYRLLAVAQASRRLEHPPQLFLTRLPGGTTNPDVVGSTAMV